MPHPLRSMPLPLPSPPDPSALAAASRRQFSDCPRRVTLTIGDAERVIRLIDAIPDARGRAFLSLSDAVALAFDIAANVMAAGELDRFRTPPPEPLPWHSAASCRVWNTAIRLLHAASPHPA